MTKYPTVQIPVCFDFELLSEVAIKQMAEDYFRIGLSYEEIKKKYNISVDKPNRFEEYFPPFQHHECICPKCEVISWIDYKFLGEMRPYCPVCGEVLYQEINPLSRFRFYSFKAMYDEMGIRGNPYYNSL